MILQPLLIVLVLVKKLVARPKIIVAIFFMSDLDKQFDQVTALLNQCAEKLSGDLFEEQIEIYDLAFSRAELLAARVIKDRAKSNSYLRDLAGYFCAEAIHSVSNRISRNNVSYGIDLNLLPNVHDLQPFWAPNSPEN